ncbi:DUF389 domain-containing protein [Mangrovimonas cancribranchiae]|uniref:DUF389 domain-containing protein n=1 Tax=Mangrovimonas cancribranchiae TaxID=3080055 RepID=A0AAU6P1J2_9FLAO
MEENKFNFNEDEKIKEQKVEESKEAVRKDAKGLIQSVKKFLDELLDFRDDTDRDATIEAIKNDISFKGATAWILICSIFVASIGLNANSTAVVIGAMLISPLMGPILGVGMSIAINDIDTLKRSLINLAIMIVLSLITAFLFFYLFPLSEDNSELLGRTRPDIRDVLIAFFGGLALIIARTKKGTIASVIFGVAIATALMPPLCTAGYGLAQANFEYFLGALYLFTINTIFIALATFIVLKILRFPMLKYANSKKRKRIARIATTLAIVVMFPATWTFVQVLRETNFNNAASSFIDKEVTALPHGDYLKKNATYNYMDGNEPVIEINTFGLDEIPEETIALLEGRLKDYSVLNTTSLIINQNDNDGIDSFKYMQELKSRDSIALLTQNQKITILENRVKQLSKFEKNQIPMDKIGQEIKINYDNLERLSFSNVITSDFSKIDTISVFTAKWKKEVDNNTIEKERKKLEAWLNYKLDLDSLIVRVQS